MAALLASLFSLVAVTQFTTADKSTCHNGGMLNPSAPIALPVLEEASEEWLLQEEIPSLDDQHQAPPPKTSLSSPSGSSLAGVATVIPSLTELPTPVPDLLVLLVALAGFGITCRFRRFLHARAEERAQISEESTDAFGCTKLHVAAHGGSLEEVQRLLKKGSNPNAQEAWDETPLHMASRAGHLRITQLLVTHGAHVNMRNADDETPLVVAARAGRNDVCSYLLEMGAGTGGLEEERLPCLLSNLLLCRPQKAGCSRKRANPVKASWRVSNNGCRVARSAETEHQIANFSLQNDTPFCAWSSRQCDPWPSCLLLRQRLFVVDAAGKEQAAAPAECSDFFSMLLNDLHSLKAPAAA